MEVVKRYDKCVWCNKSLTPIGHARLFGANHPDWQERNTRSYLLIPFLNYKFLFHFCAGGTGGRSFTWASGA